jgi:archaetidylinositol phosphate synthase
MGLYVLKYPYRRLLLPLGRFMAGVDPDILSYAAVAVGIATGAAYGLAGSAPGLLLAAVGLILIRMTLNTLDGVIAVGQGKTALSGEVVNALPDRYSDIFLLAGIAVSPFCRPWLGLLGTASTLLVSYTGMLGKALGVEWQHHGPLGKVERLILVMVFSLLQYAAVRSGSPAWGFLPWPVTPLEACMALFVVLGQVTVANRTRGMLRQIARLEWRKSPAAVSPGGRVLLVYDSQTGNTRKVAAAIAEGLRADLRRAEEAPAAVGYDLVVIGSPVVSSKPTAGVMKFLSDNPGLRNYAFFVTYGAPVIGRAKVRKCFRHVAAAVGSPPLATFACKGRHALVNTYKSHPDENDLLEAFLFGMRLARKGGPR